MTSRSNNLKTDLGEELPHPEEAVPTPHEVESPLKRGRGRPRKNALKVASPATPVKTQVTINNALSPDRPVSEVSEVESEDVIFKMEPEESEAEEEGRRRPRIRRNPSSKNSDFFYYEAADPCEDDSLNTEVKSEQENNETVKTTTHTAPKQGSSSGSGRRNVHDDLLGGRRMKLVLVRIDEQACNQSPKRSLSKPANVDKHKAKSVVPVKITSTIRNTSKVVDDVPRIEFPEFDTDDSLEEPILLEVCVDNNISIVNAAKGGAKRIELCSSLAEGGLTPTPGLLRMAKANVKIPVFVMIRPRGGDFVYSNQEIEIMTMDIMHYKEMGADGFVFGVLDNTGSVEEIKCKILMRAADPLPCTFHRAFDMVSHPLRALESITKLGFCRILTSGQQTSAELGIPFIRQLVRAVGNHISIMAGAGLNPGNVAKIIRETGVKEVHGSARVVVPSQMQRKGKNGVSMGTPGTDDSSYYATDPKIVAQIVKNASTAFEAANNL